MTMIYHQHTLELDHAGHQQIDNYIDHDGTLAHITRGLSQRTSILLLGPRMSGKTHLMRSFAHLLHHDAMFLHTEHEPIPPQNDSIKWLIIDDIDKYPHPEKLVSFSQHFPQIKWLISAQSLPTLADLSSRCQQCLTLCLVAPRKHSNLYKIIKSIANRYQYQIKDSFIKQAIDFLPWNPELIIHYLLGHIQECYTHKQKPSLSRLKSFYKMNSP